MQGKWRPSSLSFSHPPAKMARHFPIHPANPQRICWGCDKYCAADSMACSAERTPHLAELFGDDWQDWTPGCTPPEREPDNAVTATRSQAPAVPLPLEGPT